MKCLELGININKGHPCTPLHYAVMKNSLTLVKLLLEAGADTRAVSSIIPINHPRIPIDGIKFHHNFAIADYILKVEAKRGMTTEDPKWNISTKNRMAWIRTGVKIFRLTGDVFGGYGPIDPLRLGTLNGEKLFHKVKAKTSKKQDFILSSNSCAMCGKFSGKLLKCSSCKMVGYW